MPILKKTKNSISNMSEEQLSDVLDLDKIDMFSNLTNPYGELALGVGKLIQPYTDMSRSIERLVQHSIEPAKRLTEAMEIYTDQFCGLGEALNMSLNKNLKSISTNIFESLSLDVDTKSLFPQIYSLPDTIQTPVIDREVEEELTTEVIPAPNATTRTRSRHGLSLVTGNIVTYKRKILRGISSRNIEGRYLILLLSKPNLFLSDVETRANFYISGDQGYYWIKSKLQKRFRKNGLRINLERVWNPDGYVLAGIEYLH